MVALQNRKLRRLIKHSFENVPYYNRLFRESGIRPEDIRTVSDLEKIPLSKKSDLCDLPLSEISVSNVSLVHNNLAGTSGSSGVKLQFYREKRELLTNLLRHYLFQLEVGDKISNRHASVGGAWLPSTPFQRFGIFPTRWVSPFSDTKMQIRQIKQFKSKALIGLPSSIREIAKQVIDWQVDLRVSFVFGGGEMLDSYTRGLAEKAFGAEVFSVYGMTEAGGICGECRLHHGQHVWSDQVIVETTRDGERAFPGETGSIVVTVLNRFSTPFIRYDTEDLGMLLDGDCPCGSRFHRMEITEGRSSDVVLLNDGRVIPAHELTVPLAAMQGIRQIQVTQESIGRFTAKIVKDKGFDYGLPKKIVDFLKKDLGEVEVEVFIVDNIPRLKSGKLKLFISKIK